jgi:HPt (histidine-containing phosphotransfer) domain-containing protein
VQEVVRLFFKGAAGLLKDLERGAAAGDVALLHSASHALKSASANIGAMVLSAHCRELEAMTKSGSAPNAIQLVEAIREEYDAVEFSLSTHLPRVA